MLAQENCGMWVLTLFSRKIVLNSVKMWLKNTFIWRFLHKNNSIAINTWRFPCISQFNFGVLYNNCLTFFPFLDQLSLTLPSELLRKVFQNFDLRKKFHASQFLLQRHDHGSKTWMLCLVLHIKETRSSIVHTVYKYREITSGIISKH